MRNRLISGLSDAVIVVEARAKSGSLITADLALDQGKEVYAVPGRYNDLLSYGCNRLIGQGAGIVLSTDRLLEELSVSLQPQSRPITMQMVRIHAINFFIRLPPIVKFQFTVQFTLSYFPVLINVW